VNFTSQENLEDFVSKNSFFGKVNQMDEQVIHLLFKEKLKQIYLFCRDTSEDLAAMEEFTAFAQASSKALMFITIKHIQSHFERFGKYLNVNGQQTPFVVMIYHSSQKYLLNSAITRDSLSHFIKQQEDGKLVTFQRGSPPPDNDFAPVKTIVTSTFDELVMKSGKDVLLMCYAPWC